MASPDSNTLTRLWDVKHPHSCSDSNYYQHGVGEYFKSWRSFLEWWEGADKEDNYLFRWDWHSPRAEDDDDSTGPILWEQDEAYRDCELYLFFVYGGKGIFACNRIGVCRADEPRVREWLRERLRHLVSTWGPLTLDTPLTSEVTDGR